LLSNRGDGISDLIDGALKLIVRDFEMPCPSPHGRAVVRTFSERHGSLYWTFQWESNPLGFCWFRCWLLTSK
jgi:hypothetical protein